MAAKPKTAIDSTEEIHNAFLHESDRAAGIVAGAMLDAALLELLKARLIEPPKKERSLLDGHNAPLGTFSARIDAAFQLGLISRFLARDLHIIRNIRNHFAHAPLTATFEMPPVSDLVGALEEASDYNRRHPETRETMGPPGKRGDLLGIVAWILFTLQHDLASTERVKRRAPEFGYIRWEDLPEHVRKRLEQDGDS